MRFRNPSDAAYQLDLLLNQFAAFHKPGMDR